MFTCMTFSLAILIGRGHLHLLNGYPALIDPAGFAEEVRIARLNTFELQRELVTAETCCVSDNANTALHIAGRRKGKLDAISRLSALWMPTAPKLIVIGSRISEASALDLGADTTCTPTDSSGRFLVTGDQHTQAVINHWKQTFATTIPEASPHDIAHLLNGYPRDKWDWSKCTPFTRHLASEYVSKLKHTGTGKDGIHNYCFKNGGTYAIDYVVKLMDAHFNCRSRPADINDGLFAFLSKVDLGDDSALSQEGVYRSPDDLRPLTLTNADNKLVAGITTCTLTHT